MPANLLALDGRQAIVTGAGRGLGRAHAIALAERGARVVVNDIARDEDGRLAEKVVAEIRTLGGSAVAHTRSISDPDTATTLLTLCRDTFGPVDIVVNNAGVSGSDGVEGTTDESLGSHLAVHVAGAFSLIRAAWNDLGARGDGRIVNTTSGVGLLGYRRAIGYAAAKSALVRLSPEVVAERLTEVFDDQAVQPLSDALAETQLIRRARA